MRYSLETLRGDILGGLTAAVAADTACVVLGLSGAPAASFEALDIRENVPDDQFATTPVEAKLVAHRLLED